MSEEDSGLEVSSEIPFVTNEKAKSVQEELAKASTQGGGKKKSKKGGVSLSQAQKPKDEVQTPMVVEKDFIAEEIWSRKTGEYPRFAVKFLNDVPKLGFKAGDITMTINGLPIYGLKVKDSALGEPVTYVPIYDDLLKTGAITVPDDVITCTWDEVYQDGVNLALEIYDCDPEGLELFKLLILVAQSSWFLDRLKPSPSDAMAGMGLYAPIVAFRGSSGSGKNRAMGALRMNAYRPLIDVMTTRVASLYRPLSKWRGSTLLLDEADCDSDEGAEIVKYLDARVQGVPYIRINPNNVGQIEAFTNFGFTIVTQRRGWGENAVEDRTLPFYSTKSIKPIPTVEKDEWPKAGRLIQNKMLFLRLKYWEQVHVDKAFRFPNVYDNRLTASLLTAVSLQKFAPTLIKTVGEVVHQLDRQRRIVKAMSYDGQIINALWEWIKQGLVERWVGSSEQVWYIGKEKSEDGTLIPATTADVATELGSVIQAKNIRSTLVGLNIATKNLPDILRVGNKKYRAIFFVPGRLDRLLQDLVVDYKLGEIIDKLPTQKQSVITLDGSDVVDAPQATETTALALKPPR